MPRPKITWDEQRAVLDRVRAQMARLGISKGGFAAKMGVERTTVWKWENSKTRFSMETIQEMERQLNLPANELLKLTSLIPASTERFMIGDNAVEVAISNAEDLTPEGVRVLLSMYRQLQVKGG